MRASGWQIFLAMLRLPLIGWHLGRAGTLGHMAQISLLPSWMRRLCSGVDRLIRSHGARRDAGSEALGAGPQEFAKFLDGERAKWGDVIRRIGLTLE